MPRRFPRTIRRFPRTAIKRKSGYSMNALYYTLYKIARGESVSKENELIACRWLGKNHISRKRAKRFIKRNVTNG